MNKIIAITAIDGTTFWLDRVDSSIGRVKKIYTEEQLTQTIQQGQTFPKLVNELHYVVIGESYTKTIHYSKVLGVIGK